MKSLRATEQYIAVEATTAPIHTRRMASHCVTPTWTYPDSVDSLPYKCTIRRKRRSAAPWFLGSRVRIPPRAWLLVRCVLYW